MIFLYVALAIANLFWIAVITEAASGLSRLQVLPEDDQPNAYPPISILVPARNETRILSQTLESLLKLDYPDFEILVVDDHSEDGTFELAESFAKKDSRVRAFHGTDLPPDWRGKSWALQQGATAANGNWILCTDADMTFHPSTLRRALAAAQKEKIDLYSILPNIECHTFWERVVLPAFAIILSMVRPLHKSNDPKSKVAIAAGGFLLTKSLIFRHIGGFHLIRESIAEDAKLAELYKHYGYRLKTVFSRTPTVCTRMYETFGEMWEGLSRHAFEGAGNNPVRMIAALFAIYFLMVAPAPLLILGLIAGKFTLAALCAFPVLAMIFVQAYACRRLQVPIYYGISFPLAAFLYGLMMAWSMFSYYFRGGNLWKGRRYGKPPSHQDTKP